MCKERTPSRLGSSSSHTKLETPAKKAPTSTISWISRAGGSGALAGSALVVLSVALACSQKLAIAFVTFCVSLPFWLPPFLIAVRFRLLTDINGDEGIQLPNKDLGVTDENFKWLYNHKSAQGRSQQANYGLSDFFW